MEITLKPEDEEIVQRRLQSGAFASIDDIIHYALQSLDAEETWLQSNKEGIHDKIGRGLAELDSGEGLSGEGSRDKLRQKKTIADYAAKHGGTDTDLDPALEGAGIEFLTEGRKASADRAP